MASWDRRVAAVARVRDNTDPEAIAELMTQHGLPDDLHPDDKAAALLVVRMAKSRPGFGTVLMGRRIAHDETQEVRISVTNNNDEVFVKIERDEVLHFDPVTGLLQRDRAVAVVGRALQESSQSDRQVAVYMIDIDRLKSINDTDGYAAGDHVILTMVNRIQALLAPSDTMLRVGGNTFAVVLTQITGPSDADSRGDTFRGACSSRPPEGASNGFTVSIGLTFGGSERGAEEMLRYAETALVQAKAKGRDRVEVFSTDLQTQTERRLTVDHQLRSALENDDIEVLYQPVFTVADGRMVGAEGLLRVISQTGEPINTRELVAAAEDAGLIRRVEDRVLEIAGRAITSLPDDAENPRFLSVNISSQRLSDTRFPLALAKALHIGRLTADQLKVELDGEVTNDKELALRLVGQLHALGVGVVIDGFTGSGNTDIVMHECVEIVKLHRDVIRLADTDRGRASARLMVETLHERQVLVCAVGVETAGQYEFVREIGCDLAQGYLLSAPVPAAELERLVSEGGPIYDSTR